MPDNMGSTLSPEDEENVQYIFSNGAYRRLPVYEQSVSIIASLDDGSNKDENSKNLISSLGLTTDDLPVVISVGVGILVLLSIIFVLLICSCRKHKTKTNHNIYRVQPDSFNHPDFKHDAKGNLNQSDTMVMLTGRERVGTRYESYLVEKVSDELVDCKSDDLSNSVKKRPQSQPIEMATSSFAPENRPSMGMINEERFNTLQKPVQSCEFLSSVSPAFFISCEELDESSMRDRSGTMDFMLDSTVKSRSLPNWGKLKPRPLSTTDDIRELRAKVNYTKKKKNRMKHDSAAAIAMTRSRTNILTHTDTESLVDNEAVVVYDERTAL